MQIGPEHALDIIQQYCTDEGIEAPKGLARDFRQHIGEAADMTSFSSLKAKFCTRVRKVLGEDKELGDKYGEFFSRIQSPVRLRMARILGLEEYATQPMRDFEESPREVFRSYLESLKPGQSWNTFRTEKLRGGIGGKAGILIHRLRANIGEVTRELVADVLGEDAEEILARNPFERENKTIKTASDASRYLREFLSALKPHEKWYAEMLDHWTAQDEVHGFAVTQWIRGHCGGTFSEPVVRTVLGDDSDKCLSRNPFIIPHPIRLRGKRDAGKAFGAFLKSLPEGESFCPQDLLDWVSAEGVPGSAVYHWIRNNFSDFTEGEVRILLGDEADELLSKHPFHKQEKKITNIAAVRRYLMSFLEELPKGASWSSVTLQKYGKIGEDGPSGGTLHVWIRNNYYREGREETHAKAKFLMTEALVREILGPSADAALKDHPFEVRHENVITTRKSAAKYLRKFMQDLPAGASWSPTILQFVGEIGDGVYGYSVFGWIARNEPKRFSDESIRGVLGNEADELLARNPFERTQIRDSLKTMEDVRRHLAVFVDSLPKGKAWSPSTLCEVGRFHPESPTGNSLHRWILQNVRNNGKPDWLFVLVKLLPESSLQQHPFINCRSGLYLGHRETRERKPAATSRKLPDISEQNFGRGLWDQSVPTPEDILIDKEERKRIKRGERTLKLAIGQLKAAGTLTREEDTVLTKLALEEDVDPQELNPILQKLRQKMLEIDPRALHEL